MPRLNKATLTDKLTGILERGIRSGKHVAGRRLPSTRELAADFGVSQQVVKSAFAELEAKGLVLGRERDGVYVNPDALVSSNLEFALLSMRRLDVMNDLAGSMIDYAGRMLSVGDATLWAGVNFVSRNISRMELSDALLRYELDNICARHPDCLIVAPLPSVQEKTLNLLFGKLPFPVVLIGDFDWQPGPDFKFSQIAEDNAERGEAFVNAAHVCGAKSIICVGVSSGCWQDFFKEGAQKQANFHSMDFRYASSGEHIGMSEAELSAARRGCIRSILKEGLPDALAFDGCGIRLFEDELAAQGIKPGRDITVICDKYMIPGTVFLKENGREFSIAATALLKTLASSHGTPFGRKVLHGLIKRSPIGIVQCGDLERLAAMQALLDQKLCIAI